MTGRKVTMNQQAREAFLAFAESPTTLWSANFRDLGAAVTRMATMASGGRITVAEVEEEILRLTASWRRQPGQSEDYLSGLLTDQQDASLDLFDRVQLSEVVRICRQSATISAAGRILFASSRANKAQPNDADRLRKYLARFQLSWAQICPADAR